MACKTVIFDVDGTLLNSEKIYMSAWVKVGTEYGYTIPQGALLETRAVSHPIAKTVFRKYCGEDFPYDEMLQVRKPLIEEMFDTTPPEVLRMPYAMQTLQALREQGYTIAAASSTHYENSCRHLRHAGLYEFFDVIVCGDMVEKGKPAPDIFLKAAELAKTDPSQCVVVGDTPADVLGATAAGIPVILIPDQVPANAQTTALSLCILPDLSQVPQIIEKRNSMMTKQIVYKYHSSGIYKTEDDTRFSGDQTMKLIVEPHDFSLAVGGEVLRATSCPGYTVDVSQNGAAAFFDKENNLLAQADEVASTYPQVKLQRKQGLLTIEFGSIETVDHYPNCDGEHDRWSEKWVARRSVTLKETDHSIEVN